MVALEVWQKRYWLKLHKEREKWKAKNPGKFYPTRDPTLTQISNYTCALCEERKWYKTNGSDKDAPQYHKIGKRTIILCHGCWHLKGIYKKHVDPKSMEGSEGCRYCHLKAASRLSGRKLAERQEVRGDNKSVFGETFTATQPSQLSSRNGLAGTRKTGVRRKGAFTGR